MKNFNPLYYSKILKWIGILFMAESGRAFFTDYAVLQSIDEELNMMSQKLRAKLLEDYEETLKRRPKPEPVE